MGTRILLSRHFRFRCSFQDAFNNFEGFERSVHTKDRTFYASDFTSPSKIYVATLTSHPYLTFVDLVSIPSVGSYRPWLQLWSLTLTEIRMPGMTDTTTRHAVLIWRIGFFPGFIKLSVTSLAEPMQVLHERPLKYPTFPNVPRT